jgi:FtsH-binding integral membrane protein
MMELNEWLMLLAAVVVGIAALFVAASAEGGTVTGLGLAVFVAAIGYAIYVIKRYFDRVEGHS